GLALAAPPERRAGVRDRRGHAPGAPEDFVDEILELAIDDREGIGRRTDEPEVIPRHHGLPALGLVVLLRVVATGRVLGLLRGDGPLEGSRLRAQEGYGQDEERLDLAREQAGSALPELPAHRSDHVPDPERLRKLDLDDWDLGERRLYGPLLDRHVGVGVRWPLLLIDLDLVQRPGDLAGLRVAHPDAILLERLGRLLRSRVPHHGALDDAPGELADREAHPERLAIAVVAEVRRPRELRRILPRGQLLDGHLVDVRLVDARRVGVGACALVTGRREVTGDECFALHQRGREGLLEHAGERAPLKVGVLGEALPDVGLWQRARGVRIVG